MKKNLLYLILTTTIIGFLVMPVTAASTSTTSDTALIRQAVNDYKRGNYIGCISRLRKVTNYYVYHNPNSTGFEYVSPSENNAVAWYYLGASYMRIGLTTEAIEAFDRVVKLNQSPRLTSYALQAKLCIEGKTNCQYYNLKKDEIESLKANPDKFFDEYNNSQTPQIVEKDPETIEIERLIQGQYGNNIHPEAQDFINQQKMQRKQNEMNH